MGGRIQGFLGGVLFTSALTYLTKLHIQSKTDTVRGTLQDCTEFLETRNEVKPAVKDIIEFRHRPMLETVKDIWNEEIIYFTNKLYSVSLSDVTKYFK